MLGASGSKLIKSSPTPSHRRRETASARHLSEFERSPHPMIFNLVMGCHG